MKKCFILVLVALLPFFTCTGQIVMPLYSDSIPNSIPGPDEEKSTEQGILIISKVSRPTLTYYPAPRAIATGAAVIICPGGGYSILAAGHEGKDVALRFNEMGISAFVLKYRIPDNKTMPNKEIGPLQDAQRALQMVRQNAKKWKINPRRIGIMGFSAGGHLAATAGTHFDKALIDNPKKTSLRPDFLLLIYPVISFRDSIGHMGSRNQLLGPSPSPEKVEVYSNEMQVRANTPPAFLVHAKNDFVKIENSQLFAAALDQYKIPNRLLVYESGGHGYGMVNPTSPVRWMDELQQWLKTMKLIR